MRPDPSPRRWWPWLLLLALASCGRCSPPQQSSVDVPTTIEAVKAQHAPPEVVVSVERRERKPGGGGACGHSALCILFLPMIVLAPLFPEKWDEVRVERGGVLAYEGRFGTDGRFLEAVVREGAVKRSIGVLPLDRLGKHVIVELARAPLDAGGAPGEYVRSPILPQVDLRTQYAEKLGPLQAPRERADLLIEYATWLQDEALPWLRTAIVDEPPESASRVLGELCGGGPGQAAKGNACVALLEGIEAKPSAALASLALPWTVEHDPADRGVALGRFLIEASCGGDGADAADSLLRVRPWPADKSPEGARRAAMAPALVRAARACNGPGRLPMLAALGEPLAEGELRPALSAAGPGGDALAKLLDPKNPAHRRALAAALGARLAAGAEEEPIVGALGRSTVAPDAAELDALTTSYLRPGGADRARRRACAIERYYQAGRARVALDRPRAELQKAWGAAGSERPALAAALLFVGERERASTAIRAFNGSHFVPHGCHDVTDDNSLAGFALFRAGCTPEEALALQSKARPDRGAGGAPPAEGEAAPDPLCTRADAIGPKASPKPQAP